MGKEDLQQCDLLIDFSLRWSVYASVHKYTDGRINGEKSDLTGILKSLRRQKVHSL